MAKKNKNDLTQEQREALFKTLKIRFEKNMKRHKGIDWNKVQEKLNADSKNNMNAKLLSLSEMEKTGGEPDVIGFDKKTGEYIFIDCSLN